MEENRVKNKAVRPQTRHLKPCKPGETANPNGRPLGQKNYSTLYKEALIRLAKLNDKEPEDLEIEILSKGIMNARSGDYRFYKDILDRLYGSAMQKSELTGKDGKDLFPSIESSEKAKKAVTSFFNESNTKNPQ